MRIALFSLVSFLICSAAIALLAQDESAPQEIVWASRPYSPEDAATPQIRVQSNLVEVSAVVFDRHDRPVPDLKKSDFQLFSDGKPQEITNFSVQTAPSQAGGGSPRASNDGVAAPESGIQPRSIALFFDDVNGRFPNASLRFAREAAMKFVRRGLDPGEKIGIFTASGTLQLDFTANVEQLYSTLDKLRVFQRMQDQSPWPCPPLTQYQAWVITHFGMSNELLEAMQAAKICCAETPEVCAKTEAEMVTTIVEGFSFDTLEAFPRVIRALARRPGSRVLLLTSSGFLTQSFAQEREKVIEAAIRGGVVINSLDTRGVTVDDRFGTHFNLLLPLSEFALGTGGKFIHNNNDLESGFRTLSAPPDISYMLGFAPEKMEADGRRHTLKVKLAQQGKFTVNARPAYFDPSPELSPAEKRFQKLQQAVLNTGDANGISAEFSAMPKRDASGKFTVNIAIHVDVRKLPFQKMMWGSGDPRQVERLVFITALFGEANKFLTGVEGVMDLRLKEATLKDLETKGIEAKLSIQAPAGSYRVRQVVQESAEGRMTAITRPVQIN